MGGSAWVTLATNDSYSLGALVLAHSLKQVGTAKQLVVLVTPGVTNAMREKLSAVFNVVQEVNILDSKDESNLRLLKRPELGVTFTKLHCWRLTQFDKCVFLDADTLVLKNCDELFEREELSAAPDVGWPDCFNSGVFVYRPSNETYEKLVQFALEKGSFDGGDQGLLNLYFADWATKDISKHLPFIYNLCSTACYSYLPAFKQFGADAKIIHFIGTSKPWLQYFNTETKKVQPSPDVKHLERVLQYWWDLFCNFIHPNLSQDMARSSSDVTHTSISPHVPTHLPHPESTKNEIWDPWEEYDQRQSSSSFTPQLHEPSEQKPIESHNTNAYTVASVHVPPLPPPVTHFYQPPRPKTPPPPPPVSTTVETNQFNHHQSPKCEPIPVEKHIEPPPSRNDHHIPQESSNSIESFQNVFEQPIPTKPAVIIPQPPEPNPPVPPSECKFAETVCTETTLHTPEDKTDDSGLAGAFAQLTLGAPRTAEQSALDDHLRRQGWEVGNIDYLGRDSFDNIWSKICETLSTGPAPTSEKPAKEPTTPPTDTKPTEKTVIEAPQVPQETKTEAIVSTESPKEVPQNIVSEQKQEIPPQTTEGVCQLPPKTQPPPAGATQESVAPPEVAICPAAPVQESPKAAEQPPAPSEQPPKAAEQPPKAAEQPPKAAEQPPKAAEQPPASAEQPPKTAEQPPTPAEQPPKVAEQPPAPAEQPPKAAEQPPAPAEQPPKAAEQPPAPAEPSSIPAAAPPAEKPATPAPILGDKPQEPVQQPADKPQEAPAPVQSTAPTEQVPAPIEKPQEPTAAAQPTSGSAEKTEKASTPAQQPLTTAEKPQEPPAAAEAPKEPPAAVEAPKEPAAAVEAPKEPPAAAKPQETQALAAKPQEPTAPAAKPQETTAPAEIPTPAAAEPPKEPPAAAAKPQETPALATAPAEIPKEVPTPTPAETPKEVPAPAEKPKEAPSAPVETPKDVPASAETPKEVPAPAEKLKEAPAPAEKPQEPSAQQSPAPVQEPAAPAPTQEAAAPPQVPAAQAAEKVETASAAAEAAKPKSGKEGKQATEAKKEGQSASSAASPTPPPRKSGGGGKKSKSKK